MCVCESPRRCATYISGRLHPRQLDRRGAEGLARSVGRAACVWRVAHGQGLGSCFLARSMWVARDGVPRAPVQCLPLVSSTELPLRPSRAAASFALSFGLGFLCVWVCWCVRAP